HSRVDARAQGRNLRRACIWIVADAPRALAEGGYAGTVTEGKFGNSHALTLTTDREIALATRFGRATPGRKVRVGCRSKRQAPLTEPRPNRSEERRVGREWRGRRSRGKCEENE